MKQILAVLLLSSLAFTSCSKSGGGGSNPTEQTTDTVTGTPAPETPVNPPVTPAPAPAPVEPKPDPVIITEPDIDPEPVIPPAPVSNLPAQALSFQTNIKKYNFNNDQEEKYDEAIALVKLVVATEEFKNKVLNHTYNGIKQFADNKGRTNAQIYQTILDGAETLQPTKNNRMDLEVELYYASNSTVGYTYPSSKRIWVNTKFFNQYAANSVAGNLFHEWLHKLGYTHDASVTAKRPYTVPYAVGYIMRDIAKKFL